MPVPISKHEHRTWAQLKEHYDVEKELATRLRASSREERKVLYASVYDELFRRVPLHPQLTRKASPQETARTINKQIRFLHRYLGREAVFMEIGAGDCALTFAVARSVKKAYAFDVSEEITKYSTRPQNFELILFDGCNIPLPGNSVNIAYSNQIMEHLNPDDAVEQVESIHRTLASRGLYICMTPNRLNGPHDVSMYFDDGEASGFHLKEYTNAELDALFRKVGFSKVRAYAGGKGIYFRFPLRALKFLEALLHALPRPASKAAARWLPVWLLLHIYLVAEKLDAS